MKQDYMVYCQEKSWSTKMEPEMAGIMELVDKDDKTTIISLPYTFKKVEENNIMKWKRKILKKRPSEIYGDEKYIIWNEKKKKTFGWLTNN